MSQPAGVWAHPRSPRGDRGPRQRGRVLLPTAQWVCSRARPGTWAPCSALHTPSTQEPCTAILRSEVHGGEGSRFGGLPPAHPQFLPSLQEQMRPEGVQIPWMGSPIPPPSLFKSLPSFLHLQVAPGPCSGPVGMEPRDPEISP